MGVAQPVVIHFELEHAVDIRQFELDLVLATWEPNMLGRVMTREGEESVGRTPDAGLQNSPPAVLGG